MTPHQSRLSIKISVSLLLGAALLVYVNAESLRRSILQEKRALRGQYDTFEEWAVSEDDALTKEEKLQLTAIMDANEKTGTKITEIPLEHRRRLSWWSFLFFALGDHCPPIGPPHTRCVAEKENRCFQQYGLSCAEHNAGAYVTSDGEVTYGGDGSDGSSSSHSSTYSENSSSNAFGSSLLWIIAAFAASAAIAAVVIAQRRLPAPPLHPLSGSVKNRMKLFSQFADRMMCNDRSAARVVEVNEGYQRS